MAAPRYALVTGCSAEGIGSALCAELAANGFHVFATARDTTRISTTLAALPTITTLALDVTSPASLTAAAETVRKQTGGRLDVLCNNAGAVSVEPLLDADLDAARRLYDVNVWGLLAATQGFAPLLIEARGAVVNIGSLLGMSHRPYNGIYASSKAAVHALSETMRHELAPFGVRVVTCVAGGVKSRVWSNGRAAPLPEGSRYGPAAEEIAHRARGDDVVASSEPAEQFAKSLVRDVLSDVSGKVYHGSEAGTAKMLFSILPTWLIDRLTAKGAGLEKLSSA